MTDHLRQRIQHARLTRRGFTAGAAALAATPFLRSGAFAQDASPVPVTMEPGGEDQLEIFSWWTSGGEAAGLDQLFAAFSAGNPQAEIVNAAVAGGAGSNAQAALQTRLSGGQAPDSWQSHPGQELFSLYVDPGYTEAVNDLYTEQGWLEAYPQGLIDQCTRDGNQYLVPVGIHRGNVFFYNKQVLADNGIEAGDAMSFDQFFAAAETLKAAGIPALALGSKDTFASAQFFENTLLGVLGPDGYNGLWDGTTGWDSAEVTSAIETFSRALDYLNPDHAALTWDGAVDVLIQGKAAFTSMGDWAYGEFVTKNVTDIAGWVTHPGTEGAFVTVVDGFTLPVGAPHPINARNWLRTVGSKEAQEAFSPFKGCIPARTDIDTSKFEGYFAWSIEGLASVPSVPSMAHGAAASPQFRQAIFDATVPFIVDRDVETFQVSLQQAAEDAGIGM
jgi:glucose/mannose transport system substrate-binding protein